MLSDKISAKFQRLCDTLDTDTDARQIDQFRQIILFRSNGLCPAKHIVSSENGTFLSSKQLCDKSTYESCVKRKSIFEFKRLEGFLANARAQEVKMQSSQTSRCAITKTQEQHLSQLAETYKDDCQGFRTSLLTEPATVNVVAIHVCRWDGTPRKSVSEIQRAICMYPSSPQQMSFFLKVFLAFVVGAATGLAIDQLLMSEAPHISKIQCGNTRVTLIGDTHQKKLRFNYLSRFLSQIQKEGSNPQSVILTEARPWENVNDDKTYMTRKFPLVTTEEQKERILSNVKDLTAPVNFFITALAWDKGKFLLPHHEIVPYDYRVSDPVNGNIYGFMAAVQVMKELQGSITLQEMFEAPFVKKVSDLDQILKEQIRRLSPPFLDHSIPSIKKLAKDYNDRATSLLKYFGNLPPLPDLTAISDATEMLNDMLKFHTTIADVVLVSKVQRYMQQGIPNIYAFMGYEHMAGTERLLRETLACV
jgi:hypothetical protein